MELTSQDRELLEARWLPCKDCGEPVEIVARRNANATRMWILRERIGYMLEKGWQGFHDPRARRDYFLETDLEEMRRRPGVNHRGWCSPERLTECAHCGERFTAQRSTAVYCSGRCRVAAHRAKAIT